MHKNGERECMGWQNKMTKNVLTSHIVAIGKPKCKCAKLHTMAAASNNKDHMPLSLYYHLFVPHIYGCYSSRTSRSWWITHSTQCQPRGCNNMQQFNHSYLRSVRLPSGVFTRNAVAVRTAKGNCWCGAGTKQNISVRNISNWHIFVS